MTRQSVLESFKTNLSTRISDILTYRVLVKLFIIEILIYIQSERKCYRYFIDLKTGFKTENKFFYGASYS